MFSRASAIAPPGIVLSQPVRTTSASNRWPSATSSIESAITSRETRLVFMPLVPIVIPSEIAIVFSSIGVPPASRMPSLTFCASARRGKLHGIVSIHVLAPPTIGLASASASKPMPWRYARAAARCGPSVSARERCLGSNSGMGPESLFEPLRRFGLVARGGAGGACGALEPHTLPLAQAPEVALDLARVHLAAGQVQVGLADEALLVTLERHPLGQHVVGVRQAHAAIGLGLVRELDAVLV